MFFLDRGFIFFSIVTYSYNELLINTENDFLKVV